MLCGSPWAIVERATFPVPADEDPRAAAVPCCRTTTQLDDTCPLRRNIALPLPYITPNHITIPSGHATTESSTFFCTHLAQSQLTSNNFKNTTIHNGMSLLLHLLTQDTVVMSRKAQTLEQRRRNAKFLKEQEAKMGKSEDQIKSRQKGPAPKVPVSPFWISMSLLQMRTRH